MKHRSHCFQTKRWIGLLHPLLSRHRLRMPMVASVLDNFIGLSSFGDSETLLTEKNVHFLQQKAFCFWQK